VVDGDNYDDYDNDYDKGSGHNNNDDDDRRQRRWRILWAGWPPPDEEGETT
jgi:hypothetical protein